MVGARRIRSKKLREHQYRKGYVRSLEGKGVEWDGDNEQVKWAMVESAREVCSSVRGGNDEIKAAVRRKEVLFFCLFIAICQCMEAYRETKRKVKRCIYQSRKKS